MAGKSIMIKLSGLHDAEIISIKIQDQDVLIGFSGSKVDFLRLEDVQILRVEDFLKRNIISVAWLFDRSSQKDTVNKAVCSAMTMTDKTTLLDSEAVDQTVADICAGRKFLIELEPSWGASLFAICMDVWLDGLSVRE
jgi:hypothetical protein